MEPFQIGDVIAGKYEITRLLGQGGMGVVVAARHRELGELVALKFLRSSLQDKAESYARFAREARTATRIKNEHVARIHDAGTVDGVPYMVMEYLSGEDLGRVIKGRGPLPAAEAVDLLLQACEAIADAHNLGIVHRDLKPANLFLTTGSDGTPFVKVLDFGISKSTSQGEPSVTASAAVMGSPLYMSPEQLASSRAVDARADIWSLGVILYEMLTGQTPFAGESFATLAAAILRGHYPPAAELRPDVPAPLEMAIAGALARDPAARPQTVAALAAQIAPCGSDAARVSCQRIERIAARAAPPAEPDEGAAAATTVQEAPPESVARVLGAPGEVTRPPAMSLSVAAPRRRPIPRLAQLALGACVAGLVVAGALVGLHGKGSSSPGTISPPAASGVTDAMPFDVAHPDGPGADASAAEQDAAEASWQATPLTEKGFSLGDFAVAAPPSLEHPRGVVAAVGYATYYGNDPAAIVLLAKDLASGARFATVLVGNATEDTTVKIARAPRGVLVAKQDKKALQLGWYTSGDDYDDDRLLPNLATKTNGELRGFAVYDDRIVLATGGDGTTTVWILDDKGRLLTSHACRGMLFAPGDARLVRMGDRVIVANLLTETADVPVCAGSLHGPPRWREVSLHDGALKVTADGVYFSQYRGPDKGIVRALDENLQPTGAPLPATHPVEAAPCKGVTGTTVTAYDEVAGLKIISTTSCCGDPPGGLFVCRPPH